MSWVVWALVGAGIVALVALIAAVMLVRHVDKAPLPPDEGE